MKKFIIMMLFILSAMTTLAQNADIYQGKLEAKASLSLLGSATNPDQKVYIEKNADGTLSLKVYNLVANFKGTEYAIGNVTINNFTQKGDKIHTQPKSATEDNVIVTPGDDPSKKWIEATSMPYTGDATMTSENLSFSISLKVKISLMTPTITLTYDGKHIGTGIDAVIADEEESQMYNISGIPVMRAKGLIIKNGKKTFIH